MLSESNNISKLLTLTRESDLNIRGSKHKVYNYDGNIVNLIYAKVWYSYDGNCVEPTSYSNSCLCNTCTIC